MAQFLDEGEYNIRFRLLLLSYIISVVRYTYANIDIDVLYKTF